MSTFGFSSNAVQLGGLAVFAISTVVCARTAAQGRRAWRSVAWLQLACFSEVLFGLRHHLHDAGGGLLRQMARYNTRHDLQVSLLVVLIICTVLVAAWLWHTWRQRADATAPLFVAFAASGFSVLSFSAEVVSLHSVDAWLYAPFSIFNVISLLWAAAAATVCVGAVIEARR
ncbi:MAG: hypothetical protein H7143_10765 [Pseudorhodobacter sp.]|nr:hypothetical protein [Rhizobacter sp.]